MIRRGWVWPDWGWVSWRDSESDIYPQRNDWRLKYDKIAQEEIDEARDYYRAAKSATEAD